MRAGLAERLPASLELTGAAMLLALAGGIGFGMVAALKPGSLIDHACRAVLWTCALRNALVSILTACGAVFSFLLGANILVEKVFGWPGSGAYAVDAVLASDYAPAQGFVVTMAALHVAMNLGIDIACALLDPWLVLDG